MSNGKTNILMCLDSFYDGGAEMFAIRLSNELREEFNITFLELNPFLTKDKHQLKFIDRKATPVVHVADNFYGKWIYGGRKWFLKDLLWQDYNRRKKEEVLKLIREKNIHIVHSHSWVSDTFITGLKDQSAYKHISSFHGEYEILLEKYPTEEVISQTVKNLAHIDEVVYLSPAHNMTLDRFHYPTEHRHRIFHGLEFPLATRTTSYQQGEVLKLILVGRGIREKGWEEAILAVDRLRQKYPGRLQLSLVGHGAFLDELKAKYRAVEEVTFLGYQDHVRPLIEAAHIGLLPSYYPAESLPNTIIEFLFCGKPVIATRIGAIPEMLEAGADLAGTIIALDEQRHLSFEALAAAIETYLVQPAQVADQSAKALTAAGKFSLDKCIQSYRELYNRIR